MYETEPEPGLNGRRLRYPRGKVLGGLLVDQRHDLHARAGARLRQLGGAARRRGVVVGAGAAGLRRARGALADGGGRRRGVRAVPWRRRGSSGSSGSGRTIRSSTPSPRPASEAGIPARADFNDGDNEGVGYFEVNQRAGLRWNAAQRLPPAGAGAGEPRGADRGGGGAAAARAAGGGARLHRGRAGRREPGGGAARGGAERGGGEQPEAPAALGAGAGGAAQGARDRGGGGPAGGRRQPAGPPADPERLQGDARAAR